MVQVGWVIVPTTGGVGVNGCVLMTTLPDAEEVHPDSKVTVKVYVPAASPDTVVLVPVPVVTVPPGVLVNVHVPVAGNPFKITLPVAVVQVGCVMVPIAGGVGVIGLALMTTFADAVEVHPEAFVTVKVYVPDGRMPVTVVLVPVPEVVVPPGVLVNVHVPVDGKLFRITLPVANSHVGWVIVPTVGVVGVSRIVIIKVVVVAH
jgi:hypothetical protein